jgi:hypothetical protein
MMNKKLIAFVFSASILTQSLIVLNHFSQAGAEMPENNLNIISVLDKSSFSQKDGFETSRTPFSTGSVQSSVTPASEAGVFQPVSNVPFYILPRRQGQLPTTIQPVQQSPLSSSLFVNGVEVFELFGSKAHAKTELAAKRLYQSLLDLSDDEFARKVSSIRPEKEEGRYLLKVSNEPLMVLEGETISQFSKKPEELIFDFSNRTKRSLGGIPDKPESFEPLLTLIRQQQAEKEQLVKEGVLKEESSKIVKVPDEEIPAKKPSPVHQIGFASWYGGRFHGRRAADGSIFNTHAMTAAHKTLPFGTLVRVTNKKNHRSCIVKITDRGPFVRGRVIDLSRHAAKELEMLGSGVTPVSLQILEKG